MTHHNTTERTRRRYQPAAAVDSKFQLQLQRLTLRLKRAARSGWQDFDVRRRKAYDASRRREIEPIIP